MRERALLSVAVVLFFITGYFGVGWLAVDPTRARTLATPLDAAIPFLLESVVIYWSILPMGLLPIFVVRDPALFRRIALAYTVVIALALTAFVILPVNSLDLRPDASSYASAGFSGWLLRLLYFVDPPLNLFPSLHLALATLAALAARYVHAQIGAFALVWTACIAAAVCTTKQHFIVDVVAGIALGGLAHLAFVARGEESTRGDRSFGSSGIARFASLVAVFYAALYGAYRAGVDPWTWAIG